ncbi:MAG: hypothetical protein AAFX99_25480, partial [Myxococcota bacterium]
DFSRGQPRIELDSQLPIVQSMTLFAPIDAPWTETWSVECNTIWRCTFDGTPVLRTANDETYAPFFGPWPGEELVITVERPEGVKGPSATVDKAAYDVTPGDRVLQARLVVVIRASQGGWHTIGLPAGAQLRTVTINGKEETIRPIDGAVTFPIAVGRQEVELAWQQPWERSTFEAVPVVDLGSSAVNAQVRLTLGEDRWPVWTVGPAWGPAILFWSKLLILLLIALLVAGTLRRLPVKPWEWLLLVVGMTQMPYLALLPLVVWFVLLEWRRESPSTSWWLFNLVQVGIVVTTGVALLVLYRAIVANLVGRLDFYVYGGGSSAQVLGWYVDQISGTLPTAGVVSLPLWSWRVAMLLWALWLGSRLLVWLPWGWQAFQTDGLYRAIPKHNSDHTDTDQPSSDV